MDSDVTDRSTTEQERERLLAAERAARAEAVSALNALAESNARHRELFENARDSILVIDLDRRIADVNAAAERMSGYTRDELVGLDVLRLVSAETSSRAREQLERTLSGSAREAPYEIELVRKDGQIVPVEINSWLVEERGRPIAIEGIFRDVSERHELEEQLRHAQKMDALGRLAGGISHDFNNLLTAIAGYSEFLLAGLDEGSSLRHDAEEIRKAAARAADLTRQLLAFSRRQVLEPRVLSLNGVISDTEKMLGRLIGEHIDLVVRLDAQLGRVRADPGQIEQVIVNLAVNARDAMPQGGRLTIETSSAELGSADTAQLGLPPGP